MVGARDGPEERLAVEVHGHAERQVRVVRDARVGAVVEKGVALFDIVEELGERPGREVDGRRVHRDALLDADQPVVVGEDRAGHVARDLDDTRLAGAQHAVAHLAQDGAEAAGEHREQHRVEVRRRFRHGAAADGDRVRCGLGLIVHGGYPRRPGLGCAGRRRACQIRGLPSIGPPARSRVETEIRRDMAGRRGTDDGEHTPPVARMRATISSVAPPYSLTVAPAPRTFRANRSTAEHPTGLLPAAPQALKRHDASLAPAPPVVHRTMVRGLGSCFRPPHDALWVKVPRRITRRLAPSLGNR